MKSYIDWLEKIQSLTSRVVKPDLFKTKEVLDQICHFSSNTKVIVVTGTNGKGSTIELITQMLLNNGKKVGTYTSPHLFEFNERIRVNGIKVTEEEIVEEFESIEKHKGRHELTFFEYSTLAALSIFSKKDLDYLVLEVGIGGRLDTVNIMNADISIVTNIDLDHQKWLGDDVDSIGKEKSGIFRKKKPVVLGSNMPLSVFETAKELSCPTYVLGNEFSIQKQGLIVEYKGAKNSHRSTSFSLREDYVYLDNLAIAITTLDLLGENINFNFLKITEQSKLPGRCEFFEDRYLMDVSHNPSSVSFLKNYLTTSLFDGKRIFAVLGVNEEKDVHGMIRELEDRVSEWFIAEPKMSQPLKKENISQILCKTGSKFTLCDGVSEAFVKADSFADKDAIVLVFGSFFTVNEAYFHLKKIRQAS